MNKKHSIKLNISTEVYRKIKSAIVAKRMSDSLYGIIDNFTYRVVQLIDDGVEEYDIDFKKNKKKD